MTDQRSRLQAAWRHHERKWRDNRYVYAVVSRRSGGISIGINLNPDKACNFDCIYCQVDRTLPPAVRRVDLAVLAEELDLVLKAEADGSLYEVAPCSALPPGSRGVRDIAFSGDGEPTTFPRFGEAVRIAADARRRFRLDFAKLVLITDGAYLNRPAVRVALSVMDDNNGEIWAKLDAGTEGYYRLVDRPNVPFQNILDNILEAARVRALVIQSLFLRVRGMPPSPAEIEAYCRRLSAMLKEGAQFKEIQIYTIARKPAEPYAAPLSDAELDTLAQSVRSSVPVPVVTY